MNKPERQFAMFSFESPSEEEMNDPEQKLCAYYLTNQNNLLDILSSGFIKPQNWVSKYYDDLSRFCPSGIPMLLKPPSEALISETIDLEENFFPVLIEVDLSGISGASYYVDSSFEFRKVDLPDSEDGLCIVVQHAIPVNQVNIIYFRRYPDLKEYKLRIYENVPQGILDFQPAQSKFINPIDDFSGLPEALGKVNEKLKLIDPIYPVVLDSLAGGQLLVMKLTEIEPRVPLDVAASMLNQTLGIVRRRSKKWIQIPDNYQWIELILSLLPETNSRHLGLAQFFKQHKKSGIKQAEIIEWLLSGVTIQQLAWVDRLQYSPEETLTDVFSKFFDLIDKLEIENNEDVTGVYTRIQEMIVNVRDGLEDLDTFMGTYPPESFPTTNALLHFLLRNKPEFVLKLKDTNPELPDNILVMTSIFSGLLTGRTKLAVDQRPGLYASTRYVDQMVTGVLNQNDDGIKLSNVPEPIQIDSIEKDGILVEMILAGKEKIFEREISTVIEELEEISPPEEEVTKHTEMITPETVSTKYKKEMSIQKTLKDADLTIEFSPEYKIALEICTILHWLDLISTVIPLEGRDYILEHRKGRLEFRVSGHQVPKYRLRSPEEFKMRLSKLLDKDLKKLINAGIDKKI